MSATQTLINAFGLTTAEALFAAVYLGEESAERACIKYGVPTQYAETVLEMVDG